MSKTNDHPTPKSDVAPSGASGSRRNAPTAPPVADLLSSTTSLDDLFNAILGDAARESDERGPIVEAVEAQVREIRQEVGLVDSPPAPRSLPEFVPIFRTQPPAELTFSSAQGMQWTVARPRILTGLIDLTSLRRVPPAVLVAVPAAAALFIAGIYWGTASRTSLPTPPAPTVLAANQATSPWAGSLALPDDTIGALSSPPTLDPAPAVARPQGEDTTAPTVMSRGVASDSAAITSTQRAASARAPAPASRIIAAQPEATPVATLAAPRSLETPAIPAPVGTSGTTTPAPVATPAAPVAEATPRPTASVPVDATSAREPALEPAPTVAAPTPSATAVQPTVIAPALPPAPPPAPRADRVTREAILLSRVTPVYPEQARRLGTTGDVDLDIEIDATGRVVRASPVSGPRPLRDAAEAAVMQWRYQPQLTDGAAVPSRRRVRVSFR